MKISGYLSYYKRNLWLAFPVVLSQIGQVSVHFIDNVMVGHVGTIELAAASFANNIFMVGMYLGMGITFGLTPLTGQAFAQGNKQKTSELLKNGIFSHFVSGVALGLIMFGFYYLLPFMGQSKEVLAEAKPYYLWLCASYLPFMMFFSLKQFFEGIGNTKVAMAITLSANFVNVVVNYVLIFGKLGFPPLGLVGAGIGTFVSRLSMPVFFAIYIYFRKEFAAFFKTAHKQVLKWEEIISVLKVGLPIGLQIVTEVAVFGFGAIMMGWINETTLAAHQVALGLASLTYMISLGVSSATTIRVSHQLGQKNYASLKKAAYASTHLVLFFMTLMAIVFIVFKGHLPYIFTTDEALVEIASGLLVIAAIFQVFDGLQVVMLGVLRGMADVKVPMFFAFFAYILVGIPASYVSAFVLKLDGQGIWIGFLLGLGVAGIMFYLRFRYNLKKLA